MSATRLPILYRCGSAAPTIASTLMFTDLTDCREEALHDRIGLGRAVMVPRLLACPCDLLIEHVEDLPDILDQQIVAMMLQPGGSRLSIAGKLIRPDNARFPLLEVLRPWADGWTDQPKKPPRQADLPEVCWGMRNGLKLSGREVADVLNEVPLWRSRSGGSHGFTEQSVSHYANRHDQDGTWPPRAAVARTREHINLPDDSDDVSWKEIAEIASIPYILLVSIDLEVPDDWDRLDAVKYSVLRRVLARNDSTLVGASGTETTPEDDRQLDQILEFTLRVAQEEYVRRPNPTEDRAAAAGAARQLAAQGKTLDAIANALNRRGFRSQRRGRWHRSAVKELLKNTSTAAEES